MCVHRSVVLHLEFLVSYHILVPLLMTMCFPFRPWEHLQECGIDVHGGNDVHAFQHSLLFITAMVTGSFADM